ncbi:aldehyde dehydrogenase family protein [Streptomyces sp. 8L]|uniref:aldehyde dehydrogenase family protein n=1 Tax=Streptomyces sp. 8L TaxID=2877242 RepID=UPI001CD4E878|nr:aldehyde dehydrogenase family protein [Streptomyces sp. 8L]MCA1219018.1 aldehyde dehydrogenase family protein [Streptomyces sp. 8L]
MITQLDALGPAGPFRTRDRADVTDVYGQTVAELSLVPSLYVKRTMKALGRARPLPLDLRLPALERAGEMFADGTVAGMTAAEYRDTVCRLSGTPLANVSSAVDAIRTAAAEAYTSAQAGRPNGAALDWRDAPVRGGSGGWVRRGEVFAVHAAGNHPGVHALWLEAVALGFRVAVRPSRREPLTPFRLVSALREAGFGDDGVALLPTDHATAGQILLSADLSMVYGGQEVIDKYADDPTVLPNGPGRSKILITADTDWREHIDVIVDSVARHGGTACVNATAVFVEGDPAPLAAALAERLATIPSLPPHHEKAVLPVHPLAGARAIERHLLDRARGARAHLGGDGVVDDLGDGSAVLRPAVFELDDPAAPQTGVELPFPCVWVAPWTRQAGARALTGSLVLTALTSDEDLLDELYADPDIRNLYIGDRPTHWMAPGVPHDDYLSSFLMRSKALARG